MRYFVVDAFTGEAFGGNPAGVVLLGEGGAFPSDRLMQLVAAELRYSETAFVRQDGPTEFTVRYFTPAGEVDLCGHATIATFGVLRHEGILSDGAVCMNHTLAGDLEVSIGQQVMMQMAAPQVIEKHVDAEVLYRIMTGARIPSSTPSLFGNSLQTGVEAPLCHSSLPIEVISTGLPDIIMPVADVEALNGLRPDMVALSRLSCELDVVGVHAFALTEDGHTAHVRNFAPRYDIPEESATGTANGALTHYLHRHGLIPCPSECHFLQGEAMGRPSVVTTALDKDGSIRVGGQSRIVAIGDLLV